jgi:hypothetical protein
MSPHIGGFGGCLPEYKIYLLDRSGHVTSRWDVDCGESDTVMALAAESASEHYAPVEVWQGTKCVGRVEPERPLGALAANQ